MRGASAERKRAERKENKKRTERGLLNPMTKRNYEENRKVLAA